MILIGVKKETQLKEKLYKSLVKLVGEDDIPKIEYRRYSSYYNGLYKIETKTIIIYLYQDKKCRRLINFSLLFNTLVHEYCHHMQYSSGDYIRVEGVMHNTEFWEIYNSLIKRAYKMNLVEREYIENDNKTRRGAIKSLA